MKAIVMAGGSGTRLWPLSRGKYPKQFIKLKGMEKSFFQLTIDRCFELCTLEDIFVVTNRDYEFIIRGQIDEMGYPSEAVNILLEPQAKNTLPAIYNGVKAIRESGEDTVIVMTSDHLIPDAGSFAAQVSSGAELAARYICTFGVKPTFPETGFGYIMPGKRLCAGYEVAEFKEKPDYETAKKYVDSGYLWNSGMFMFNTALFVDEVKAHSPQVYEAFQSDDTEECFNNAPKISIDYGLMEKSSRVAVLPLDIEWNDIGSFATFYDYYADKKDDNGNITFKDEVLIDAAGNMVYAGENKLCALVGVDDLVVVDQDDAMLICKREHTQDVKAVFETLKARGDRRTDYHLTEYRPWGSFTILEEGDFYKIKRLTVLPDKQLSYQMHYHRSEHWIVVRGTATVTVDGEDHLVRSGESIFVNTGNKHRLANRGKLLLEVIEVQSGQYLGEDDIVRFEDDFGRK